MRLLWAVILNVPKKALDWESGQQWHHPIQTKKITFVIKSIE